MEPIAPVELDGFGLRVHQHADTPEVGCEPASEDENESEQLTPQSSALSAFIDCESREPQSRHGMNRKSLPNTCGKISRRHLRRGHSCEPEDYVMFDRDVGRAEMVTELILAGVAMEEPIQLGVA